MSAANRMPSLGAGLGAAFVLSACGAALLAALTPWLGVATALRAVIALLGLRLRAVRRSAAAASASAASRRSSAGSRSQAQRGSSGLPLVGLRAACTSVSCGSCALSITTRACCRRSRISASALLGAAFAVWAAQRSGSAWLALWCFFLVQAFHVLIPATLTQTRQAAPDAADDAFARAHRAAEAAVRRLSSSTR